MNDLKVGTVIEFNDEPHEVLEARHLKMGRGKPTTQTKLRSLISSRVLNHTFQQSDKIQPARVEKVGADFKYRTKDEFFFVGVDGKKFGFKKEILGEKTKYIKKGINITILLFKDNPVSVELPIKVTLRVKEAPPGEKGDTAQGGTKNVTVETGAKIKTPLFVKSGDKIEINTSTGEYVRRV